MPADAGIRRRRKRVDVQQERTRGVGREILRVWSIAQTKSESEKNEQTAGENNSA